MLPVSLSDLKALMPFLLPPRGVLGLSLALAALAMSEAVPMPALVAAVPLVLYYLIAFWIISHCLRGKDVAPVGVQTQ